MNTIRKRICIFGADVYPIHDYLSSPQSALGVIKIVGQLQIPILILIAQVSHPLVNAIGCVARMAVACFVEFWGAKLEL